MWRQIKVDVCRPCLLQSLSLILTIPLTPRGNKFALKHEACYKHLRCRLWMHRSQEIFPFPSISCLISLGRALGGFMHLVPSIMSAASCSQPDSTNWCQTSLNQEPRIASVYPLNQNDYWSMRCSIYYSGGVWLPDPESPESPVPRHSHPDSWCPSADVLLEAWVVGVDQLHPVPFARSRHSFAEDNRAYLSVTYFKCHDHHRRMDTACSHLHVEVMKLAL